MLKCWQELPTKRPTFEELVKEFDAMLVSLSDSVSSKLLLIRQSIIYGCGLSERLYEKKLTPFPEPKALAWSNCLALTEMTRLGEPLCRFIWRTVGPAWRVYTSFYFLTHSLSCLSVPFQKQQEHHLLAKIK